MVTVGIRELKQQASELVRLVRERGHRIQITYRGKAVALIVPLEEKTNKAQEANAWAELDDLAAEIGRYWPRDISAARAVAEERR